MIIATDWLALSVVLCLAAWHAKRQFIYVSLPIAVCLAAYAVYLPTGTPRLTTPPKGDYTVIGADIQVNIAIFVLLKAGDMPPTYYKLPYSNETAGQLQQALNAAQGNGGQGVKAIIGEDGGQQYSGDPPVTGEAPKTPEVPAISIP